MEDPSVTDRIPVTEELERLLSTLGKCGFTTFMFDPNQHGPQAIAVARQGDDFIDVMLLRGSIEAVAYRVPVMKGNDRFNPRTVLMWTQGKVEGTMASLLTWPPIVGKRKRKRAFTPPPDFGISQELQRRMKVRKWGT